ncbi:permease prefix domain 1-containing protein [Clostridium botulinum]|uniref:Membrane protein n=2 Tax=Clostridium botulinum TaxID=1491 RepID=A0A9Q1UZ69_CLOBO|nr:permease prefix domain 1-containing protein [Clostridium botulinum]AEB74961.1 putative membrane protein [Clostridium botulinum BKT015925]KEI02266.1 membrane protein [Clostridium botulinum C/D str. Sp77]KEI03650.1 membrane protein [Clostridium botulinum D str. 16868]KLU77051.1 membrane protein [Clostridium botulinum V891]KOA74168.1 membrane protein [Clostridium botulinum]
MKEFDKFINNFLDISGINDFDKMDLKDEIKDHLMLLKLDYIKKGYSEGESIRLAIRDFGEENFIGREIKRNLPSKNKAKIFYKEDKIKCILDMFLSYYLFIFLSEIIFEIDHKTLMFNILLATIPSLVGFIYINIKVINNNKNIYNLKFILVLYFIIEKLIMSSLALIYYYIKPSKFILYGVFKNYYVFNKKYIISYSIVVIVLILIQLYINKNERMNIKNTCNLKVSSTILGVLSLLLMIAYYLIPNRWYFLYCTIEKIIQSNIEVVSKNIIFILINNKIIIPNLGLIIFIFLLIKVFRNQVITLCKNKVNE